jgi:hypothetical protein
LLEAFAVAAPVVLALTVDGDETELEAWAEAPDDVAAAVEAAAEDTTPLISAWTVALKVPVMPVRLFEMFERWVGTK